MTGPELKAIRRVLCGTDTAAFGLALGYSGNDATLAAQVRRLERMPRIPGTVARLAAIYQARPRLVTIRD